MVQNDAIPNVESLKALELKLAECLGEAGLAKVPLAASLIGAALEEVGSKLALEYGVTELTNLAVGRVDT